jgi:hypothetical protein
MKAQLSHTALWLAPALAVAALATVGHPPSFISQQASLVRLAEAIVSPANQSSCGYGVIGQYSNLHHNWVCSAELTPGQKP